MVERSERVFYARYGEREYRWLKVRALSYDGAKKITRLFDDGYAWLLTVADMADEHPDVLRAMKQDTPLRLREAQRRVRKRG